MTELENEENVLSRLATAAEVEPCPKEHRSLLCRAEAPRRSSVDSFSAKEIEQSSSTVTTGRESRKVMKDGEKEVDVEARLEPSAKANDLIDAMRADFGALRSEVKCAYQMLELAMKEYCFVRYVAFDESKDL